MQVGILWITQLSNLVFTSHGEVLTVLRFVCNGETKRRDSGQTQTREKGGLPADGQVNCKINTFLSSPFWLVANTVCSVTLPPLAARFNPPAFSHTRLQILSTLLFRVLYVVIFAHKQVNTRADHGVEPSTNATVTGYSLTSLRYSAGVSYTSPMQCNIRRAEHKDHQDQTLARAPILWLHTALHSPPKSTISVPSLGRSLHSHNT